MFSKKNKKKIYILVIDGQGYIGNILCKDLIDAKYNVISIDKRIYNQKIDSGFLKNRKYKNYNYSISKKKQILNISNKCDYVVFLASAVGDPITKKYPKISTKINEKFTISLLKTLSKSKIKKLIFISTCSNYGISKKVVNENSN